MVVRHAPPMERGSRPRSPDDADVAIVVGGPGEAWTGRSSANWLLGALIASRIFARWLCYLPVGPGAGKSAFAATWSHWWRTTVDTELTKCTTRTVDAHLYPR